MGRGHTAYFYEQVNMPLNTEKKKAQMIQSHSITRHNRMTNQGGTLKPHNCTEKGTVIKVKHILQP